MDSFYLTIPSDKSFASNKPNNFSVKLPNPIVLDGKWEVALAQISYPKSNYNITGAHISVLTLNTPPDLLGQKSDYSILGTKLISVPNNSYSDIYELIEAISYSYKAYFSAQIAEIKAKNLGPEKKRLDYIHIFEAHSNGFTVVYDKILKRVRVTIAKGLPYVDMGSKLVYALGFTESTFRADTTTVATYPPDVDGGIKDMYIYTPLIEYQVVGGVMTPLLRIVPLRGNFGEQNTSDFTKYHYVNVLVNRFDTVEFSIKDQTGSPIAFAYGTVVIKLHFRKK